MSDPIPGSSKPGVFSFIPQKSGLSYISRAILKMKKQMDLIYRPGGTIMLHIILWIICLPIIIIEKLSHLK